MLQYLTEWLDEYIKLLFLFYLAALCACNADIAGRRLLYMCFHVG